jgi:cysteine desulfurase/selenocysteine lyase
VSGAAAWARIRDDFPVLRRHVDGSPVVYLDSAATSLKPAPVIDAVTRYYTDVGANIHRGKHMLSEEASDEYEATRRRVAEFIGAQTREVVFVANTTHAINIVAAGLGLQPNDLVLLPYDVHHSQLLPWRRAARVEYVRVDAGGMPDLDQYRQLLLRRPRVVALNHCSNVTGVYAPVEEMVELAHEAGALAVVDAAQSVPHRRIRVRELGADAVAFSAHKMLGPTGIGVLWGRAELLERLEPLMLGGGTVDWVDTVRHDLRKLPHRLEAGTPHIDGAYGLGAAVDYLRRLGADALEAHDRRLGAAMLERAARRPYLSVVGGTDAGDRAAIVSVAIRSEKKLADVARSLSDSYGVMCRSGHQCAQPLVDRYAPGEVLRFSGYVYNDEADVDFAFDALDRVCAAMGVAGGAREGGRA